MEEAYEKATAKSGKVLAQRIREMENAYKNATVILSKKIYKNKIEEIIKEINEA